jgi:diguanylate cyclase (GGDEF)-like protein
VRVQDTRRDPQILGVPADTHRVSGTALTALARLAERRFPSFSEAADAVLDVLEAELPAGSVLVGQVDWDGGEYRLIDVRGEAAATLQPGSTLTLSTDGGLLAPETLASLSVRSYLAVPLETGAGAITVCALAAGTDLYTRSHLDLIAVAGRLLAHEWESVKWRADLRRMSERLRDPEKTDPLTGLPNRTSFEEALEREWRLAERGSSDSFVVVVRLLNLGEVSDGLKELLLKDAAEVIESAIRRSDHAGRLGDDSLGAVLVGCKGAEGAEAFYTRVEEALARVTQERPASPDLTHSIKALGECDSPEQALQEALAV